MCVCVCVCEAAIKFFFYPPSVALPSHAGAGSGIALGLLCWNYGLPWLGKTTHLQTVSSSAQLGPPAQPSEPWPSSSGAAIREAREHPPPAPAPPALCSLFSPLVSAPARAA